MDKNNVFETWIIVRWDLYVGGMAVIKTDLLLEHYLKKNDVICGHDWSSLSAEIILQWKGKLLIAMNQRCMLVFLMYSYRKHMRSCLMVMLLHENYRDSVRSGPVRFWSQVVDTTVINKIHL